MAKDSSSLMTLGLVALGGYVAYEYFLSPGSSQVAASGSTGSAAGTPAGSSATGANWSAIYSLLIAATMPDTQFSGTGNVRQGTPYQWNFYLSRIVSTPLPDLSAVFGNIDYTAPMTAATYWAGMGAALGAPASSLPSPVSAQSGQQAAGTSVGTQQRPGYAADPMLLHIMNDNLAAGANHTVRGTTGAVTDPNAVLSGFGAISCADVDPSFMGPVDCIPTQAQNTSFITGLEDAYNSLASSITHPSAAPATGLAAVPWYVWAGGGLLFLAALGGRR